MSTRRSEEQRCRPRETSVCKTGIQARQPGATHAAQLTNVPSPVRERLKNVRRRGPLTLPRLQNVRQDALIFAVAAARAFQIVAGLAGQHVELDLGLGAAGPGDDLGAVLQREADHVAGGQVVLGRSTLPGADVADLAGLAGRRSGSTGMPADDSRRRRPQSAASWP